MDSEALVQLALETLSCSQKDLAIRLGVSPTQISKWKKGEHMSYDMADKISAIANIGHKDPSFVVWAGSLEAAIKWEKLIHFLAEVADDAAETGYNTDPLRDDLDLLCWHTFYTLRKMGVDLPKTFPNDLDIDYEEDPDKLWDLIEKNPYSSLIYKIYKSFTNVYGFYIAYVYEVVFDDELELWEAVGCDIDSCLLELAAAKIDIEGIKELATNFQEFKHLTTKNYEEWLNVVKERAFRGGVPLRAELLSMVYGTDEELGNNAESESLGLNSSRLHPDIYMNELLCGMRMIHQVLPAIMKKLGMDDEFTLDTSELRIK
ncbi:helix-turn-helix domain-containing protein [Undibacterium sp. JH2W]|uniref:helix-turn-helix domain-containing protein n=1 Tax=Undibacterium sp. JH2W TaxID=3413037 RepID=UPI003BF0DA23